MRRDRAKYIQGLLHANGLVVAIDGVWGKRSQAALNLFSEKNGFAVQRDGVVRHVVLQKLRGSVPKRSKKIIRNRVGVKDSYKTSSVAGLPISTDFNEMVRFFGHPNSMEKNLVSIVPAYPLFYAGQEVSSIRVHRLCADAFLAVFEDILAFYGADRIRELGLDQYSGTYNKRRIRGGRSWSTHAFGIAIDLFAAMNRMRMSFKESLFSKAEYAEFMNIWRRHGFVNLGEALDFDSMHMQWASV